MIFRFNFEYMKIFPANLVMILFFVAGFSGNEKPGCSNNLSESAQNDGDKTGVAVNRQSCKNDPWEKDDKTMTIRDSVRLTESLLKTWQEQDTIHIIIPDEEQLVAYIEKFSINIHNTISVRARFVNYPSGYMIITSTDGITGGTIKIPEKNMNYRIKTDPIDRMIYIEEFVNKDIIEIDTVLIPPEGP